MPISVVEGSMLFRKRYSAKTIILCCVIMDYRMKVYNCYHIHLQPNWATVRQRNWRAVVERRLFRRTI